MIKDLKNNIWCLNNNGFEKAGAEVDRITKIIPSQRQLDFMRLEYYNFIHFGINTFNNREWGDGKEDISIFNPTELDTDQWCKVLKDTGSKGIIITAKHHDGFCLFDSKYTDHTVMHTPFGKDIVKMLSESCKKFDLKLGIYLSPWDRHDSRYGTDEYNDHFVNQLTELATNYGEIFCFWFDGACGEGPSGKKQVYDWDRYYSVIRELQPQAVISICGPDVRWIGNEGGKVRKSEWSVVPYSSKANDDIMAASQQDEKQATALAKVADVDEDLGSRSLLKKYKELAFRPAEADVSINLGWFYHDNKYYRFKRQRTAKDLAKIYFNSVGGNASMLLNVPPDKTGLINDREIKTLTEFTRLITEPFKREIKGFDSFMVSTDDKERKVDENTFKFKNNDGAIKIAFKGTQKLSMISLREDLSCSQRVEAFKLYYKKANKSKYRPFYSGTVIGSRKLIRLKRPVSTDEILIVPTQSRKNPMLCDVRFYE